MANEVDECNVDNQMLLENAFNDNDLKLQHDNYADNKVNISETPIVMNSAELQDHLICDKMKQCDILTTLDNIKTELSLPEVKYDMIQGNVKMEEGINANDIKIEFHIGLLYCENCDAYYEDFCTKCGMLVHILNRTVLINADNKSRKELPYDILDIRDCFGLLHIFALKVIPAGVKFGPFTGLNGTELPLKMKGGKFVVSKDKSMYLNWMQYVNLARSISEQNLQVFQYEDYLYYRSTRQIEKGDELLVYFGEEYEDSLDKNVEMDFIPTADHIFEDAYACTYCCLGFSSKTYLAKHKSICPANASGGFSIEELTQCLSCKIYLDQKEYFVHHMAYCFKRNDRKFIPPTLDDVQENGRKTLPHLTYKCQQCKYRTKYKGCLKNHANLHYEVKMYKCEVCCRRFKTKEVLRLHFENTHIFTMNTHIKVEHSRAQDKTKQFKCSSCEFQTKYKIYLKRHMAIKHLKEFKYKCDTCDFKTNWKSHLKRHIGTMHLKEFKYKCGMCDYGTNCKSYLKAHVKTRHLKEFKYKCETCDYKTNFMCHLKRHVETQHLKQFKYKCGICDYKTSQKFYLKTHIKTKHLKELNYKCDVCDYKTNWKSLLQRHMEARHLKEFKYKCGTCDYVTNCKSYLNAHVETRHLKEFKYKCVTCEYKTNIKCHLKRHIETKHLKEYKCDMCDYRTNQKSHLKQHTEAQHSSKIKYKCDTCDYEANRKSNLEIHIEARHLKVFEYNCGTCDYKTSWKSSLNRHIKARHVNELKYKCDTCDYKTNYKARLESHIKSKHLK